MKNTFITLSLIAIFIPFGVTAQQTLNVNVYHPDAMYKVPYIPIRNSGAVALKPTYNPLQAALEAQQLKEEMEKSGYSYTKKNSSNKSNTTNYYTGKTGYRNSKGQLRYEHYDNVTNEIIITDSTETIVGRIVQVSKNRFNILNNKDILIAYLIRNFRVVKKYTPEGKLIKKIKIPNQ